MKTKKILLVSAHILFIIALVLTAVELAAFDRNFYQQQFDELKVAEVIGVSGSDLKKATDVLLDYTAGKRGDLDCLVEINEVTTQYYNQREIDHMADVKKLYLTAAMVRNIAAIIAIVIFAVLFKEGFLRWQSLKYALIFLVTVILFLGFFAMTDFEAFWIRFHLLFFSNDLWLLDPATDNLINMVPEEFFSAMVTRIFLYTGGGIAMYSLTNYLARGKHEN